MAKEKPEFELKRLRTETLKIMQKEVYGGLSSEERAQYDGKCERIHELVKEIQVSAAAQMNSESATREQQHQWDKTAETDTSQLKGRQTYRSREKDSTGRSHRFESTARKKEKAPEENGDE